MTENKDRLKIGILVSMNNNFGEKGFYNSQEIGLAKALVKLGHVVYIWKFINRRFAITSANQISEKSLSLKYVNTIAFGVNCLVNNRKLDNRLDGLIYYSDTQISVPHVYKWCNRNNIVFIPYIGVIESHSQNKLVRLAMNLLTNRNINVYRKSICAAKSKEVKEQLKKKKISVVYEAPVGLDTDLLNLDYKKIQKSELLIKYGFHLEDKVILFIGRFTGEKRPLLMLELFDKIQKRDGAFQLLMVGQGELENEVSKRIGMSAYRNNIKHFPKIPNDKMWELYRLSDCYVNLNQQEIFGMAILEAMYYESKVIAWHAPGPETIINDGIDGYLVANEEEFINAVFTSNNEIGSKAHKRIESSFLWDNTALTFDEIIRCQR